MKPKALDSLYHRASAADRLSMASALTEFGLTLARAGLRAQFPHMSTKFRERRLSWLSHDLPAWISQQSRPK